VNFDRPPAWWTFFSSLICGGQNCSAMTLARNRDEQEHEGHSTKQQQEEEERITHPVGVVGHPVEEGSPLLRLQADAASDRRRGGPLRDQSRRRRRCCSDERHVYTVLIVLF